MRTWPAGFLQIDAEMGSHEREAHISKMGFAKSSDGPDSSPPGAWSISSVSVMGPQLLRLSDSSLDSLLDPGCRLYPVLFNSG